MNTSLARRQAYQRLVRWQGRVRSTRQRQVRFGFTLIELLVVIGILLLLLAVAIPALAPPLEDRAMREASRGVAAAFAGARDRAISTGRPYGVQLVRFTPSATQTNSQGGANVALAQDVRAANSCFTLNYVQVPPPYAGDDQRSRMTVSSSTGVNRITAAGVNLGTMSAAADAPVGLIRPGDLVQFGSVGHLYVIDGGAVDADGYLTSLANCTLTSETNPYPLDIGNPGLPYQIIRAPVKAPATPHAIPESVVLDLTASGLAGNEFAALLDADTTSPNAAQIWNTNPVTIMFAPSGGIDSIYYSSVPSAGNHTLVRIRPSGAVYLMLGKLNQLSGVSATISNWQDLKNLWVSINARTGLIQSNEVFCPIGQQAPGSWFESRSYARERQGMGGR